MSIQESLGTAAPQRLLSLDVLRGLTIAGMILVTDPGTYAHVYPQLLHALWNGPTAADLIFPCFLVMVGISMTLSFAARLSRGASHAKLATHIGRRALLLFALGLVVNWIGDLSWAHLRLPGILQRIAVCYLLVGLLYIALYRDGVSRRTRTIVLACVCFGLLATYWALLRFYPTPGFGPGRLDPLGALPTVVDRAVFTVPHMFQWGIRTPGFGITFDPEGLLSTLGALATTLFGVLAGEELRHGRDRRSQCAALATGGTVLWLLSLAWNLTLPLNKQIYTPPFALWSAGLSLLAFAALLWFIDIRDHRRGWTFALIFGTNAILAFVLSQIVTRLLSVIHMPSANSATQPLYMWLSEHLLASWLPARPASLAFAVSIVLLNMALLYPFYRRKLFLRL